MSNLMPCQTLPSPALRNRGAQFGFLCSAAELLVSAVQVQDHPTAKPDSREAQAGYALHCRLYNLTLALHCSGDDSDLWVRPHLWCLGAKLTTQVQNHFIHHVSLLPSFWASWVKVYHCNCYANFHYSKIKIVNLKHLVHAKQQHCHFQWHSPTDGSPCCSPDCSVFKFYEKYVVNNCFKCRKLLLKKGI